MSMDEMIEYCFVAAVVQSLGDDELPAQFSAFYSQHMLKYAPAGEKLDFKKSKHKKIAKFAKEMAKRKLCTVKEQRGEMMIETVSSSVRLRFPRVIVRLVDCVGLAG